MLGTFEQHTLWAVLEEQRRDNAYCSSVMAAVAEKTGKEPSMGAVFTTLQRLEKRGFLKSKLIKEEGQPKRYYRLTGPGARALHEADTAHEAFAAGLRTILHGLVPAGGRR